MLSGCQKSRPFEPEEEPNDFWETSTPEAQNLDPAALAPAAAAAEATGCVKSLLVVRNGYIVLGFVGCAGDRYRYFSCVFKICPRIVPKDRDQC